MITSIFDKLFGHREQQQEGTSKNVKHSPQDIGDLLVLYKQHNYHLTAIVKDKQKKKLTKLSTGIEAVELGNKQFMTDQFLPLELNDSIKPGDKVLFSLTHHGVRHQFECICTENTNDPKTVKHWFGFPQGVEQIQLRNAFRVKISQAHPIKVTLTHEQKETITGTLADLSASGLRVRIDGLVKPKPERGEIYSSCHLVLGDGSPVIAAAQLVHWQFDPESNLSYLGLHFENLDGNTQRALNRYLTDLQRKQRQLS